MASKVFLDANVLLDFLLKRSSYEVSKQVIGLAVAGKVQAFISPSIVHIAGYWLTKSYGSSKAKELLLSLLVDTTVIEINHEVTVNALFSKVNDIEDALQYYTAIHHGLDYFVTNDNQFRKIAMPALPVYTPAEFLSAMT